MNVIREIKKEYEGLFSEKAIALHNAYMIEEDSKVYTYEFELKGLKGFITSNTDKYLEEVIENFHFFNSYIATFEWEGKIIKEFEKKQLIRLPISILQPSQFYICKEKLEKIDKYMSEEEIFIPVVLLDDEYVIVDGHTRLYSLFDNSVRMVNCYFDTCLKYLKDFVYFAKENGILSVKDMEVIPKPQYEELWIGFCKAYFAAENN